MEMLDTEIKKVEAENKKILITLKECWKKLEEQEVEQVPPMSIEDIAKGLRDLGWAPRRA